MGRSVTDERDWKGPGCVMEREDMKWVMGRCEGRGPRCVMESTPADISCGRSN